MVVPEISGAEDGARKSLIDLALAFAGLALAVPGLYYRPIVQEIAS